VLSAKHIVADLTLGLGTVIHDYLSASRAARRLESEMLIEANAG
jgi:acetoacetate decarboxylase